MLAIVYILSVIVTIINRDLFINSINGILRAPSVPDWALALTNSLYKRALFIAVFAIVFFTLFSIIKILDAYSDAASKKNSFDLKLSQRYKQYLNAYENSFIVGNVFMALGLLVLVMNTSSLNSINIFNKFSFNVWLYVCGLIAFISVWIQLAFAIKFSKIKND
jgi:CBS domain containing-hemolysin-like protein